MQRSGGISHVGRRREGVATMGFVGCPPPPLSPLLPSCQGPARIFLLLSIIHVLNCIISPSLLWINNSKSQFRSLSWHCLFSGQWGVKQELQYCFGKLEVEMSFLIFGFVSQPLLAGGPCVAACCLGKQSNYTWGMLKHRGLHTGCVCTYKSKHKYRRGCVCADKNLQDRGLFTELSVFAPSVAFSFSINEFRFRWPSIGAWASQGGKR